MSLSLDLWHVHHNLNVIKTHPPNTTKLIPHINLIDLISHITSRSCRQTQLSCFGVGPVSMTCVAFLVLFVFYFVWALFSWFQWEVAVVLIVTSLYSHHFSFCQHLTIVTCMNLFFANNHRFSDSPHPHGCCSVFWIFHSPFSCMIIDLCLRSISPCIRTQICIQFPISESWQPWLGLSLH